MNLELKNQKAALFNYLIQFLKADGTELFTQHYYILETMINDDNVDSETFSFFIKYFLV